MSVRKICRRRLKCSMKKLQIPNTEDIRQMNLQTMRSILAYTSHICTLERCPVANRKHNLNISIKVGKLNALKNHLNRNYLAETFRAILSNGSPNITNARLDEKWHSWYSDVGTVTSELAIRTIILRTFLTW